MYVCLRISKIPACKGFILSFSVFLNNLWTFFFPRLLVEKIFAQYMVPHSLDTEEKMKCLYYLYACLDTNAVKLVTLLYLRLPSANTQIEFYVLYINIELYIDLQLQYRYIISVLFWECTR